VTFAAIFMVREQGVAATFAFAAAVLAIYLRPGQRVYHSLLPTDELSGNDDHGLVAEAPSGSARNYARTAVLFYLPVLQLSISFYGLEAFRGVDSLGVQVAVYLAYGALTYSTKLAMVALNVNRPLHVIIEFYAECFSLIPRQLLLLQLSSWTEFLVCQACYSAQRAMLFGCVLTSEFQLSLPADLRHPCFKYCGQLRGCAVKLYLDTILALVVPLYCIAVFSFMRTAYQSRYYPSVALLSGEAWQRVLLWFLTRFGMELVIFIMARQYHRALGGLDFAPLTHGQKVVKKLATTLAPFCAFGYIIVTLVLWQHHFKAT